MPSASLGRAVTAALLLVMPAACERRDTSTGGDSPIDPARGDSPAASVPLTPGGAERVPAAGARHFDPGAVVPGDTVLGLRVVESRVRRVFDDSVWAGHVRFGGPITVTGVHQQHFDWPEPAALCFHVTDAASVDRIPRFAPDSWTSPGMKVWFCYSNDEVARELLGPGDPPLNATVVVDDYVVMREFTDVFDTARLIDVISTAGPASRSLRDPD